MSKFTPKKFNDIDFKGQEYNTFSGQIQSLFLVILTIS